MFIVHLFHFRFLETSRSTLNHCRTGHRVRIPNILFATGFTSRRDASNLIPADAVCQVLLQMGGVVRSPWGRRRGSSDEVRVLEQGASGDAEGSDEDVEE